MEKRDLNNPMQQSGGLLLDAGLTASTLKFSSRWEENANKSLLLNLRSLLRQGWIFFDGKWDLNNLMQQSGGLLLNTASQILPM